MTEFYNFLAGVAIVIFIVAVLSFFGVLLSAAFIIMVLGFFSVVVWDVVSSLFPSTKEKGTREED